MVEKTCTVCGKSEWVSLSRSENYIACSKKCEAIYRKSLTIKNVECPVCGNDFHLKQSRLNRIKNPCCSRECNSILRQTTMKGENNHQYGITGEANSSFKTGQRISNYGYILILTKEHPFSKEDYYPEHRLIAEQYLLNNDDDIIIINNIKYLKPERVVHHIDFDKKNNVPENLYIFKNVSLHTLYHNLYKKHKFSLNEFFEYYNTYLYNLYENRSWLYEMYIVNKLSISEIAKLTQSSWNTVNQKILEFNIPKRRNVK